MNTTNAAPLTRVDAATLDRPVCGYQLEAGSLRDQLASETLVVFLRHFG